MLQNLYSRYAASGLKIVHLFLGDGSQASTCRAWSSRSGAMYPTALVPTNYIFQIGGWSTPGFYLVGPDGRVIARESNLESQVRRLLGV
ncbi:MAG: hypothetical protein JNK05_03115 [Myxococcales bacterium]|nr:hypothetical protein [Myxococcales bacterium]